MERIIGIDFDNTIICYDSLLHKIALERGLIDKTAKKNKRYIRDVVRRGHEGEILWQRLQSSIYGEWIKEAKLADGIREFLVLSNKKRAKVFVISHKTGFSAIDPSGINFHEAAFEWMERKGFFDNHGIGLSKANVFFEPTRQQKCECIKQRGCMYFIDDLIEVFLDDAFPSGTSKILYDPHGEYPSVPDIVTASSWASIGNIIFDAKS